MQHVTLKQELKHTAEAPVYLSVQEEDVLETLFKCFLPF